MKEFNKKLTEEMYQKWNDGTTVAQLEKETNLSKESIYKRFGRLRKHKDDDNVTIDVESHVQDRTDADTSSIVSEEINADMDADENICTVSNYIDADEGYKISTMPSEQETEECEAAATEEDSDISKTGFVDGRIVTSVIIVIILGIIIGLYGPQIWSMLKGIKSKMIGEKIINNHEKYPVSECDDNSYCVDPTGY
ncbi:MAG: hypothetical protein OER82_03825 [Nitrosopumilus sp.]|nr:hypothetical protein [Nitrosopumilus sp.]